MKAIFKQNALTGAADERRRQLPSSVALVLLIGGFGAALLSSAFAVAWALTMVVLLGVDKELYARLAAGEHRQLMPDFVLFGWGALINAGFAALPIALWLEGGAAGAAGALVLWLAAALRPFGVGFSGSLWIAAANAAPNVLALLATPAVAALAGASRAWDSAVIVAIGGGALLYFVISSRIKANMDRQEAARAEQRAHHAEALARMMMGEHQRRALLVDLQGAVLADSCREKDEGDGSIEHVADWPQAVWSDTICSLNAGEIVFRNGWIARAWRDKHGELVGACISEQDKVGATLHRPEFQHRGFAQRA